MLISHLHPIRLPQIAQHQINGGKTADGMMVMRTEDGDSTVYLGKLYQHDLTLGTKTRNYVFNGMLVAQRINNQGNGDVKFFLTDHLGSTNTTIRANGTLEAQLRYDPWGEERYSSSTTPTGYRYTGQRQDDTLGLHDYNARYYDPTIGRFISADTIVPSTKESSLTVAFGFFKPMNNDEEKGAPLVPQFLNRYTYVLNNPLLFTDPSGHDIIEGEIPLSEFETVIGEVFTVIQILEELSVKTSAYAIVTGILTTLGVAFANIKGLISLLSALLKAGSLAEATSIIMGATEAGLIVSMMVAEILIPLLIIGAAVLLDAGIALASLKAALEITLATFKEFHRDLKGVSTDNSNVVVVKFTIDTDPGVPFDSKVTLTGYDQDGNQITYATTFFPSTILSIIYGGKYTGTTALLNAWDRYITP